LTLRRVLGVNIDAVVAVLGLGRFFSIVLTSDLGDLPKGVSA
jgi:hypothetical protein